mgnify:CR=1 FL=1
MKFQVNTRLKTALNIELNTESFTFEELSDAWAQAYVAQITGCINRNPEYLANCIGGQDVLNTLKKWVKHKLNRHDLDSYFDLVWERKVWSACQ